MTGVEQVDNLQDGVNNLVAGQVEQGGVAQPIGDMASGDGLSRSERQGRDDKGGYVPDSAGPVSAGANAVAGGVAAGGQKAAGGVQSGLRGAGGMLGLGGKEEK